MRLRISPMKWTSRALLGQLSNNPTGPLHPPSKTGPSKTTLRKTGRLKSLSRITPRKTTRLKSPSKITPSKITHPRTIRPRTIRLCFRPPKTAARCPQATDTVKRKIQLIRPVTIARRLPTLCRLGLDEHLHCFLAQSIAVCGGIDF